MFLHIATWQNRCGLQLSGAFQDRSLLGQFDAHHVSLVQLVGMDACSNGCAAPKMGFLTLRCRACMTSTVKSCCSSDRIGNCDSFQ
eukprot:1449985-Amphidinium_carterae.1